MKLEPINNNCIAFESFWGRKYSCNPAAFYEYIYKNHPEYECVWFLNDLDTEVPGNAKKVKRGTDEHRRYLATAKYFIFNNNMPRSFKKRDGQVIVHTMHGTPFKTYGLDVKEETETISKAIRVIERSSMWDYLVAQGEFTKNMAWTWFRYDKTILETGYPRTDELYRNDTDKSGEIQSRLNLPDDKKVLLYAPTWRDMDSFDMKLDLDQMRESLSEEYVLLLRLHHFDRDYYDVPEDGRFVYDAGDIDKIEDLFSITDILITDYSSVMFDFALTSKPMIFYAYDLEEYTRESRGSYFDITKEAPGAVVTTTEGIIETIKNIDEHISEDVNRRTAFCGKYLTYENAASCQKIYEEVFIKEKHLSKVTLKGKADAFFRRLVPVGIYRRFKRAYIKRVLL